MPSRVADILLAQGRQAIDAAGRGWGAGLEQVGQEISQGAAQIQQQKQQKIENEARAARLGLDTAHLGLLQQEASDRAASTKRAREGQALTAQLTKDNSKLNPDTGHWEYDHEAIMNGLMAGGHTEAAAHYADIGTKIDELGIDAQTKHLALEARKKQGYADIFGLVANAPESEREARYGVMLAALPETAKNDPVLGKLPPIYPGHEAFTGMYEAQQTDAQRLAKHKEAAEEYAKGLKEVPPGGKLVHIGLTGEATLLAEGGAKPEDAAAEARAIEMNRHNLAMEGIDTLKVGREAAAEKERERHDRAMEQHAATAAKEAHLTKLEDKDPATGRTRIRFLTREQLAGQTFEKGESATVENRLASARAVNQTGEDMIAQISNPAIAAKLGPAMGRFNTLREFLGNPPPELAELAGSIESYSLANMGVHGMRSAQGAEQIKRLLDQKHTPASLIATIRGLNKFSMHFMENEGRGTTGAGPLAPANDIRVGGTFNGRKILKVEPVP